MHAPGMPGKFSPTTEFHRKPLVSDPARAVMHVGIANPQWRGKRSRHSRRMHNPQFYVSGKMEYTPYSWPEPPVTHPTKDISCEIQIPWNAKVKQRLIWSQRYFAHICIGTFSMENINTLNLKFYRNCVSGTSPWTATGPVLIHYPYTWGEYNIN